MNANAENHETNESDADERHRSVNGNGNGNGRTLEPEELPAIWNDQAHFVLRSAEDTLVLRPEEDVELTSVVAPPGSATQS